MNSSRQLLCIPRRVGHCEWTLREISYLITAIQFFTWCSFRRKKISISRSVLQLERCIAKRVSLDIF